MVRQIAARSSASHTGLGSCSLLALPKELIQQVLGMLKPHGLLQLLQTSKAMAQEVMQHSSGRLTLRLVSRNVAPGHNLAAIKHLLQWAPPACLKLTLHGDWRTRLGWNVTRGIFGTPMRACHAQRAQGQQFPCILGVCIQAFILPTLVLAGLAAACPNLRQVHLHDCKLECSQQAGRSKGSSSSGCTKRTRGSSSKGNSSGDTKHVGDTTWPAENLRTLILGNLCAPQLQNLPPSNARQARSTQAVADFAEQLRASVPNVRCLKICDDYPHRSFIWPLIGPQLTELHAWLHYLPVMGHGPHLQQLQKLVMPNLHRLSAAQMDLLLSLPNLTHMELGAVHSLDKDYSSHPCKWQYLQVCSAVSPTPRLFLGTLAMLPLHSLTQALTVGNNNGRSLQVMVPHSAEELDLQRLSQQLMKSGVKVLPAALLWEPCTGLYPSTPEFASVFELMATAFGPHADVQLRFMVVDQAIMRTVAAVHQGSLKQLTLYRCRFPADMQVAWHAVLSACPSLTKVVNQDEFGTMQEFTDFLKDLMAAMAQEPAGRCIELVASHRYSYDLTALLQQVKEQLTAGTPGGLSAVEAEATTDGFLVRSM